MPDAPVQHTVPITTIGVVSNPHARRNQNRSGLCDEMRRIVGDRGLVRETHTIDEIPVVADEFREAGVDLLCINGGDGSQHVTLSAFYHTYGDTPLPSYLPLRGGTMNTVATSNHITGKPLAQLTRVMECMHNGGALPAFHQKTLHVGNDLGFLFGTGLVTNVLEQYYDGPRRGPGKAAYVVGRAVATVPVGAPHLRRALKSVHADIRIDGEPVQMRDFSALFASTVGQVGIGVKAPYRANETPDTFHFIGARLSPLELVWKLQRLWRGKPLDHPQVIDRIAHTVTLTPVRADNGDAAPVYYTLDGDLYEWIEPLHVTLGPTLDAVRV